MTYVSGHRDGDGFRVEHVHRRKGAPPPDALQVVGLSIKGRRKPRPGDLLRTHIHAGKVAYVHAPEARKRGTPKTGQGAKVYLPAAALADLRELAAKWGTATLRDALIWCIDAAKGEP